MKENTYRITRLSPAEHQSIKDLLLDNYNAVLPETEKDKLVQFEEDFQDALMAEKHNELSRVERERSQFVKSATIKLARLALDKGDEPLAGLLTDCAETIGSGDEAFQIESELSGILLYTEPLPEIDETLNELLQDPADEVTELKGKVQQLEQEKKSLTDAIDGLADAGVLDEEDSQNP